MILLDTHALVWLTEDSPKLGRKARKRIAQAALRREVNISAISYWELGMLAEAGRHRISVPVATFRIAAQSAGIVEIPVDGEIAMVAAQLSGLHGDPADRMIVASALCHQAVLVTADEKLLSMHAGPKRIDAQT